MRNSKGRLICDESEMARLRNSYFASTFTQEQSGDLPFDEIIYLGGDEGVLQEFSIGVEEI